MQLGAGAEDFQTEMDEDEAGDDENESDGPDQPRQTNYKPSAALDDDDEDEDEDDDDDDDVGHDDTATNNYEAIALQILNKRQGGMLGTK